MPEAAGQGLTREQASKDLADSIKSVLGYRREEALAHVAPDVEKAVVEVS